jgi:hypothetical protein
MTSPPPADLQFWRVVRLADVGECNAVCTGVHGHDRDGELRDAIAQGGATVVVEADRPD